MIDEGRGNLFTGVPIILKDNKDETKKKNENKNNNITNGLLLYVITLNFSELYPNHINNINIAKFNDVPSVLNGNLGKIRRKRKKEKKRI